MQVIDVGKRKKRMKWSVDRCRHAIFAESRKWIVTNHFIFVLFAPIKLLELLKPIKVKQREARFADGAEVAAASFHRQYASRFRCEWVGERQLRTGIATAEISDTQVRSQ